MLIESYGLFVVNQLFFDLWSDSTFQGQPAGLVRRLFKFFANPGSLPRIPSVRHVTPEGAVLINLLEFNIDGNVNNKSERFKRTRAVRVLSL